jgi:hypothetical protein
VPCVPSKEGAFLTASSSYLRKASPKERWPENRMNGGTATIPSGLPGRTHVRYARCVPPPGCGVSSTRTRVEATGPARYRRLTPNRYGRTHSNGSSSHSTRIPSRENRNLWRAFCRVLPPARCTAGRPVSRLKRFVSVTNGHNCSGLERSRHSHR